MSGPPPSAGADRPGGDGHYFEPTPAVASRPSRVRLDLPDLSLDLTTDRGVFSAEAVDAGTKLLLLDGPEPASEGELLDLGCGYGPIALTLAHRSPAARVWAVDVNERARDLCRRNASEAGITTVRVVSPEDVPDDLTFTEVWSNPPIRIGKAALHELLVGWLARVNPAGRAVLVVQRHLGADSLAAWLTDQGHPTTRLASRRGYRLLEVRPRA